MSDQQQTAMTAADTGVATGTEGGAAANGGGAEGAAGGPAEGTGSGGGSNAPGLGEVLGSLRSPDIGFAVGMMLILLMLIAPLPSWLLDVSLALSITFSILIMMTTVFIDRPVQLSSFPTILLVATMLRLGLNLASTRLILSKGHEGTDAAGKVIEAFGTFLMGGQVVIGIIIFAILVIVNFIVITKGSTRIAEVAARFALDSMPGKQMAIDSDMSAGIIDEAEARRQREELRDESSFYGAMDGASKFVRGDAVAGLLITVINIIGGLIIGIAINGLDFMEALNRYTILTVGDGLVSQIPALIVSTSAGLLVAKAGITKAANTALFDQLSHYPKALSVAAALVFAIGLLPGMPLIPFTIMAAALGVAARMTMRRKSQVAEEEEAAREQEQQAAVPAEEPISAALAIDQLRLELGYGLLTLINDDAGFKLTDQIKALRRQLATEMGFVMPSVRILDNMQLSANTYLIRVKETEVGRGDVRPGMLLIMDPQGRPVDIPGEPTTEPAFGLPATWADASNKEEANFRGYTVVDAATVVTTHLTEAIKDNMSEMLSYAETQKLLDDLHADQQKLLADIVPSQITTSGIQRVLQSLLTERVSIRDLPTILEGIAEASSFTQNVVQMNEHVRSRLARQLCAAHKAADGIVPLLTLSPEWEQAFTESLVGQGEERQLAMAPTRLQDFIGAVRLAYDQHAEGGQAPVLLTSPLVRPYVRSIIERFRPATVVMSQNEIHPQAKIRTLGQI